MYDVIIVCNIIRLMWLLFCSIITLLYYAIISYHLFVMFKQLYSMQLIPAWSIAPSNAGCAPMVAARRAYVIPAASTADRFSLYTTYLVWGITRKWNFVGFLLARKTGVVEEVYIFIDLI